MTPSDDLSPPRRPIFFPVVIATVFLTIIGMTGGFLLGERHHDEVAGRGETTTTTPAAAPTSESDFRKACPQEAIDTARRLELPYDLTQVLKIVTQNGTTVWICQDGSGSLYYQSKTGGVDKPLVQDQNGLFLTDVSRNDDNDYEATDGKGNFFLVNRERLEVQFASGRKTERYQVETAE